MPALLILPGKGSLSYIALLDLNSGDVEGEFKSPFTVPEIGAFAGDSVRIHLDAVAGAGGLPSSPWRMRSCMAFASCFWCSVSSASIW
jgi:hypothetical protein